MSAWSPNPAFRRVRVRLSLLLSLGLLTLLPWSSARDPQGLSPAKTLVGAAAGREGTRNRAAEHPVPALPPSPFTYLHGARPRPLARPDERVLFRLTARQDRRPSRCGNCRRCPPCATPRTSPS